MGCAGPIHALLVEDNPADAVLTRSLLTESLGAGIRTRCAERLSAAVRCLEQETFDVVILDLLLPDTVGLEGLRRIVRSVPGIPVVILSGIADEDVETEAFCEGAQDFLIKGIKFHELGRAVEKAINRKRTETELLRFADSPAGNVIAGDDVISAVRPVEILVIGPTSLEAVRCATETHANCFMLHEASSIDNALDALTDRSYDTIVLDPNLPDAWAVDAYPMLSEFTEDIPVLMFVDAGSELPGRQAHLSEPFCKISRASRDITQIRRLLISAALRKRALDMPCEATLLKRAVPQSSPKSWH